MIKPQLFLKVKLIWQKIFMIFFKKNQASGLVLKFFKFGDFQFLRFLK